MRNKYFEKFIKTGNIEDYMKYKNNKKNGEENGVNRRDSSKNN